MVAIPFVSSSAPGRFAESGGRAINVYAEKLPDGRTARRRVPGLRELAVTTAYTGFRGGLAVGNDVFVALEDRLLKLNRSGSVFSLTDLSALDGSGSVYFARNNKTPTPDTVAVAGGQAYVISSTTGASSYPDSDVGSPNSVAFIRGYFIFTYGDGRMRASGLNDTTINTLDTAFAEGKPDGLTRGVAIGNDFLACGSQTIEVWRPDPNNAVGFPLSFLDTIPRGIIGADAIAGFEDGWSNTIIFVGDDGIVYALNGYTPRRISTPPVERLLERLANRSTIRCSVHVFRGHPIWTMTSDDWTWCYDLSTGDWFERASHLRTTWRAVGGIKAFDRWIMGDDDTGQIYGLDDSYAREGNDPLVASATSATMSGFPNRAVIDVIEIDCLAGVGIAPGEDPVQTQPTVRVFVSYDGGVTWGPPYIREIGRQGEYSREVRINRAGMASDRGLQIRVECSDPVDFTLFGGDVRVRGAKS